MDASSIDHAVGKKRASVKTRQREQLLVYLEASRGSHQTARQIIDGLAASGTPLGTATVYRQIERLVEEGLVRKYTLGPSDPACFEYVGLDGTCEHEHCFHCVCTQCGKLIHLECDHLSDIAKHMQEEHGFFVDPLRTVFYGVCTSCQKMLIDS